MGGWSAPGPRPAAQQGCPRGRGLPGARVQGLPFPAGRPPPSSLPRSCSGRCGERGSRARARVTFLARVPCSVAPGAQTSGDGRVQDGSRGCPRGPCWLRTGRQPETGDRRDGHSREMAGRAQGSPLSWRLGREGVLGSDNGFCRRRQPGAPPGPDPFSRDAGSAGEGPAACQAQHMPPPSSCPRLAAEQGHRKAADAMAVPAAEPLSVALGSKSEALNTAEYLLGRIFFLEHLKCYSRQLQLWH